MAESVSILFVCMGNICRSPMAHGVFRQRVADAGLNERVAIDSAGTIDYHAGERPDGRAMATAARRGIDIGDLRARGLRADDCGRFDLILTMDRGNYNRVRRVCAGAADIRMFLDFAQDLPELEVPDPYSGGPEAFEYVFDLIEAAADGLLAEVRRRLDAAAA
ncbi:MAG: low molecular weight phosphotyrosine protein phosphatase [Deinococcales bacterium]|jgi:protein-tyrosine phosphatase